MKGKADAIALKLLDRFLGDQATNAAGESGGLTGAHLRLLRMGKVRPGVSFLGALLMLKPGAETEQEVMDYLKARGAEVMGKTERKRRGAEPEEKANPEQWE